VLFSSVYNLFAFLRRKAPQVPVTNYKLKNTSGNPQHMSYGRLFFKWPVSIFGPVRVRDLFLIVI